MTTIRSTSSFRYICENHSHMINFTDNLNRTPLHYASIMNDTTAMNILQKINAKKVWFRAIPVNEKSLLLFSYRWLGSGLFLLVSGWLYQSTGSLFGWISCSRFSSIGIGTARLWHQRLSEIGLPSTVERMYREEPCRSNGDHQSRNEHDGFSFERFRSELVSERLVERPTLHSIGVSRPRTSFR